MPFVPIPNGVMVEMIYTLSGQRFENVYHVTKGSPATLGDLSNVMTVFRQWEAQVGRTQRTNLCQHVQIDAAALDYDGAPSATLAIIPAVSGSQAWAATASFITLACKHTTGLGGRSFRGRTYHIGLGWNVINAGDLVSQAVADQIANLYNTLRTTLLANGWTFCIASKYSGVQIVNGRRRAIPRAVGILTPVANTVAERGIDTNRHRKLPYQV